MSKTSLPSMIAAVKSAANATQGRRDLSKPQRDMIEAQLRDTAEYLFGLSMREPEGRRA